MLEMEKEEGKKKKQQKEGHSYAKENLQVPFKSWGKVTSRIRNHATCLNIYCV